MALVQQQLVRQEISGVLGGGARTATAVITTVWNGVDAPTTTLNINEPSGMNSAELATYQAFVSGLDEIVTDMEAIIVYEPA